MSRVDFYILPDDKPHNMQQFACKLTEKAWQQGQRILIHTDSVEQSHALDNMLWTFREGSFIPHAISGESSDEEQPVLISHQALSSDNIQIMINLSSRPASADSHYERIAEIINQDPQRKLSGREHYKIYRDKGYQLHHHEMSHS
ncbi:MAG: DNA polymerase III subunit chi [Gammaproteobacteria bacterium]